MFDVDVIRDFASDMCVYASFVAQLPNEIFIGPNVWTYFLDNKRTIAGKFRDVMCVKGHNDN